MSFFSSSGVDVKAETESFVGAIDSNIDESLKHMKSGDRDHLDPEFSIDPESNPELHVKNLKIFSEDDSLLFTRSLQMARTSVSLDRLCTIISETLHHLQWPKLLELSQSDNLSSKIKNKLRSLNASRSPPIDEFRDKQYENGWYNAAEEQIKLRIEEMQALVPTPTNAPAQNLTGSSRRLRYTEAEEMMFRHWMVQGQRRNYIFNAYRKTRSKESIIHKMKSVRKQFSRPNPIEGREHLKMYSESESGHFDVNAPGMCADGPIPDKDLENFQDRINELIKTRTLVLVCQGEDDDDPYKSSRDPTAIDLNLLRNYVLMSSKVQNEFAKVEHHVLTADASWVEAANTVARARHLVENALSLTKHRAGHELDEIISAEDLTQLLGPGIPQDPDTESIVSMMQQQNANAIKRRRR